MSDTSFPDLKRDSYEASVVSVTGGVNLDAQRDIIIGGDVIGRDKVEQTIQYIYERALSDAEVAEQRRDFERQHLAQGVGQFAGRLRELALETTNAGGPYKGLLDYRLGDSGRFRGRVRAVEAMLEHIHGHDAISSLIILHAESGSGKTSLIHAGLAPRLLLQGYLPLYVRAWRDDPTYALKRLVVPNLEQIQPSLIQVSLRTFMNQIVQVLGERTIPIVFWDQFEEFFQLNQEMRDRFVAELSDCLSDETLTARFVISLRDEFFGRLGAFEPPIRYPCANQYLLLPLTRQEAGEAILEPARSAGIAYQEGLVDTILRELGPEAVAPPQLQLVCEALSNNLEQEVYTIGFALYERLGGVAGILRQYLEQVLTRNLPAEHRQAAKNILSSLVTASGQRDRKSQNELALQLSQVGVDDTLLNTVLVELMHNRLLRKSHEGELLDQEKYELVHDYLIDEIKPWVDQSRLDAAQIHDMLAHGHTQYRQYQRLLDRQQLEIVAGQLHNPYLTLTVEDYQLLLLSAMRYAVDISPWVRLLGNPALEWLRALRRDEAQSDSLRIAAAAALGQLEDEVTFAELQSGPAPLLAYFIHYSRKARHIPRALWLAVERKMAALQLRENRQNILDIGRTAGLAGILGGLVTASGQVTQVSVSDSSLTALFIEVAIFSASAFLLSMIMGDVLAGAQVILSRCSTVVQAIVLAVLGSSVGLIVLLPVLWGPYGWATGAVLGAALAGANNTALRQGHTIRIVYPTLIGIVTVLACLGEMILLGKFQAAPSAPSILLTLLVAGLFAAIVTRKAMMLRLA